MKGWVGLVGKSPIRPILGFGTNTHKITKQQVRLTSIHTCRSSLIFLIVFITGWLTILEVTLVALNSAGLLTSAFLPITASVIQGSAIGPASFVVNVADLTPVTEANSLAKYADDTYLNVPASSLMLTVRTLDLDNIEEWAKATNVTLKKVSWNSDNWFIERGSAMTPSHHRCQTYAEYLLSRYLVLPSRKTVCDNDHFSNIVSKCLPVGWCSWLIDLIDI